MSRTTASVMVVVVLVVGIGLGVGAGLASQAGLFGGTAAVVTPSPATASPVPATPVPASATPSPEPTPTPSPTPEPTPTPTPAPSLYPAILDGVPVLEAVARRHVIAVMIDDQAAARPQSGLSQASVVWQAPAEGGIPRYMALFHEGNAPAIGPVRSSRIYYIAWAAEWNAVYVHAGGSPQAIELLQSDAGRGSVVWNGDALRSSANAYLWRIHTRLAPHNVYTDSKHLRSLARKLGAPGYDTVPTPFWTFAADAPLEDRPVGTKLLVPYPANEIRYTYQRSSNTWLRSVTNETKEIDAGTDERIAPKNVVVMFVPFIPTGDHKHRLDGQVTGTGKAWFAVNGKVFKGTWKKKDFSAHTLFYDASGQPVVFAVGQTFIQVVPTGTTITITNGKPAPSATPSPAPTATPTP